MNNTASPERPLDLSILVSGLEQLSDPDALLHLVQREADAIPARSEVIAVPTRPSDFGAALKIAFESARGTFIMTMDADVSPPLAYLAALWAHRNHADVVIASRYLPDTPNRMGTLRAAGSALLNVVFRRGLSLGIHDVSRVYMEKLYGFFAPGGYADEHISHYTRRSLLKDFVRRGYRHEATRYVLRGELILAFRKPDAPDSTSQP